MSENEDMILPVYPINQQPAEKPVSDPKGLVDVVSIYYTIQGEGPFQGEPAVFIRMAGCSLQCPACDTDYTSQRTKYTPPQIFDEVKSYIPDRSRLVVLTGGEPFRQNIAPLVTYLHMNRCQVQIETNGTLPAPARMPKGAIIVCSPKTPVINMSLKVDYWKYVIDADNMAEEDGLPTSSLGMPKPPARPTNNNLVFVQPMDSGDEETNESNVQAAVYSCMKFGYRLCLQLHKIAGMP